MADVWEQLGDVAEVAGHFDQAMDAYRRARSIGTMPSAVPRLLQKSGAVRERLGRYAQAVHWYTRALRDCEAIPDRTERLRRHMDICIGRAGVEFRLGKYRACAKWAGMAEIDAEVLGDQPGLGHAYYLLHIAHVWLDSPERARYREVAVPILEAVGNYRRLGNALNNVGSDRYFEGDWEGALRDYRRGMEALEKAGDVPGIGMLLSNMAEIKSDQGNYAEALQLSNRAQAIAGATAHKALELKGTCNLGRLEARQGRFEEARALLLQARVGAEAAAAHSANHEAAAWLAELAVLAGEPETAVELAAELLSQAEAGKVSTMYTALLLRTLGYARLQRGDCKGAMADLERSLERARASRIPFEEALTLEALARCAEHCGEASADLVNAYRAVFARLGIVATPSVPLDLGRLVTTEPARIRTKPSPAPSVSGSRNSSTPRSSATAGLT